MGCQLIALVNMCFGKVMAYYVSNQGGLVLLRGVFSDLGIKGLRQVLREDTSYRPVWGVLIVKASSKT